MWLVSHTGIPEMKMTMHIDEDVLDRVMKVTGAATKREAVEIALKEMARRHKLRELFSHRIELTPEEWEKACDASSWALETAEIKVAEPRADYGKAGSAGQ